jgi:hypothetical protein
MLCLVLAGALGLLAVACGESKVNRDEITPVSEYPELIVGKWVNPDEDPFIQGLEFASDNTLKMTVKGIEEAIRGRYTWSADNNRELEIVYKASAEVKKKYAAAINAHKEPTRKLLTQKGNEKTAYGLQKSLEAIPDELPARETIKVILAEKPSPHLIVNYAARTRKYNRAKAN